MSGPVVAREPGRELDQEIAVRVMGEEFPSAPPVEVGRISTVTLFASYPWLAWMPEFDAGWSWKPRPFSIDIAAAWEVVEKMSTLGWAMGMDMQGPPGAMTYDVGFWNGREWFSDEADTAPLAICRAALETPAHPPTAAVPHSASPSSTEPAE